MRFFGFLLFCLWIELSPRYTCAADTGRGTSPPASSPVVYWYRNYDVAAMYQVLDLALKETADLYGDTEILRGPEMTQGRAVLDLMHAGKGVEVINIVPDEERERDLRPIYIASDGGLIGLRVCIINRDDQSRFEHIRSQQDLIDHGIVFGQGRHWPDSRILEANGLQVVRGTQYEKLFAMLRGRRFNCFLRGASEVDYDMRRYGNNDLMIERHLLFSYPSASIFFVNKANTALAARIELGLRRAILDGSYSDYFKRVYKTNLETLDFAGRHVIRLNNPLLSDEMLLKTAEELIFDDGKLEIY